MATWQPGKILSGCNKERGTFRQCPASDSGALFGADAREITSFSSLSLPARQIKYCSTDRNHRIVDVLVWLATHLFRDEVSQEHVRYEVGTEIRLLASNVLLGVGATRLIPEACLPPACQQLTQMVGEGRSAPPFCLSVVLTSWTGNEVIKLTQA